MIVEAGFDDEDIGHGSAFAFDAALGDDRQTVAVEPHERVVGVGQQDHVMHAEFGEDHRADAIVSQLFHRHLDLLAGMAPDGGGEGIGTLAVDEDDDARAFFGDHLHRALEHAAAVAVLAEHVGEGRERVHAHQHGLRHARTAHSPPQRLVKRVSDTSDTRWS
ncbi:hypothetical protein WR25_05956 [Diploscapter pachys]|uniref:Uncharacterized protein n=1 Tax=Diploscapter pachys TaxID=2018661 RepID=A0A2A2KAT4_9BILA|nr:hypothetical protein WR25_05956 [Diploscapter pachys]